MDVSADLTELGRTPVAVFCAGVKSILDIGRTLEYLETQGVSVVTLGSREFPAFFTRHSGFDSPLTASSEEQCARMILANIAMRLGTCRCSFVTRGGASLTLHARRRNLQAPV